MPPENEYRGPRLFRKLLLGGVLVVAAFAAATAVAAFSEVDKVVEAFKQNDRLDLGGELSEADAGKPRTILLLGSDIRVDAPGDKGRSDTIVLVRLDPSKKATAMMSLPRDLKVDIPGVGTDRINAAFSYGGPKLTVKTVKQLTGLRINHVVNVDFRGFRKAVDRIGCVYVDVDRRYFNQDQSYAAIDVKPGYRRLCGVDALSYVRFRHEDNDLVRGARQQDFLRQAKDQVGADKLFDDRDELVKIFGKYASSDIDSRKTVLSLLKLAVFSAGRPIQEIHFEGEIGPSYVTASNDKLKKLTQQFLGVEDTKGPRGELGARGAKKKKKQKKSNDLELNLENAPDAGREQALEAVAKGVKYPIYYPTKRTKGALFAGPPEVYVIEGRDDKGSKYRSYRMVTKRGQIGEYYGLQGTTWRDPPILAHPSEEREIGGREYKLFYAGDRLRVISWRNRDAVYWVSNTLLQSLSKKQMIEIARSARTL